MGSFKFGRVADAVSEGAGLFAGRKAEQERERIRQQWDLKMEELRTQRQGEAEERQIEREETREGSATARYEAGQTAATQRHTETISAQDKNSIREDVRRREESLNAILKDIERRRADALEKINPMMVDDSDTVIAGINERFDNEASKDIQSFVAQMVGKGLPGYEAESAADIKGLLVRNRMPAKLAGPASDYIYKLVSGGGDLFDEGMPGPELSVIGGETPQRTPRPPGYGDTTVAAPAVAAPVVAAPDVAAAAAPTAAASQPQTMVPAQDQGTPWQDRVDPRTGKPYPMNELFRTAGEFPKPPAGEDPYALMGQRR